MISLNWYIMQNQKCVDRTLIALKTRQDKTRTRTRQEQEQVFLKRFICLVEVHYHKVNLNSDNQLYMSNSDSIITTLQ